MTVHNDKSSLLDSLKIERTPVKRGKTSPWLYGAAGIGVIAIALGMAITLAELMMDPRWRLGTALRRIGMDNTTSGATRFVAAGTTP